MFHLEKWWNYDSIRFFFHVASNNWSYNWIRNWSRNFQIISIFFSPFFPNFFVHFFHYFKSTIKLKPLILWIQKLLCSNHKIAAQNCEGTNISVVDDQKLLLSNSLKNSWVNFLMVGVCNFPNYPNELFASKCRRTNGIFQWANFAFEEKKCAKLIVSA